MKPQETKELRDEFAMVALETLYGAREGSVSDKIMAQNAYMLANAMMEAREVEGDDVKITYIDPHNIASGSCLSEVGVVSQEDIVGRAEYLRNMHKGVMDMDVEFEVLDPELYKLIPDLKYFGSNKKHYVSSNEGVKVSCQNYFPDFDAKRGTCDNCGGDYHDHPMKKNTKIDFIVDIDGDVLGVVNIEETVSACKSYFPAQGMKNFRECLNCGEPYMKH